jgi:protein involved in polysaccharide export with SLBB domain
MTPLRSARPFRLLVCLALCALLGLPAARAQFVDNNNTGGGTPTPYGTFNAPGYTPPAQGALSQRLPSQSGTAAGRYGLDTNASPNPFGGQQDSGALQRPATGVPGNAIPGYDASLRRANLPPPRPSEFQKFVEIATGSMLPLFGARFFAEAADNFAPVDNVPVSGDYTVGPGDEVRIRAWGAIDVDYRTMVDRNGMLNLPKVGSFNVAGVKAADLEKNLRAQIGRLYTNFDLSVSLGQLRGVKVFVVGPAQRPGVYTLSSQSTMLSAVVAAGGPGPNGSMRKVLLRRDGRVVSELDIYEFLVQGDKSHDVQLAAGDVVVFQPAGARVALAGALDTPAIYELKTPQEPVREVLRYAGGTPTLANPNRAQLERVDATQPKAARFVEEFKLDGNGLQKTLRDGDVLTLLAISPQFANAVTLKGHVAQPLRYPYKPGMRIRDLIPDRDALISPDFYRRKNLLVQVMDDDADGVDGLRRLRARLERESRTTGAETGRAARRASDDADIDRADRARRGAGATTPDGTVPDRDADRMNRTRSRDEAYDARTDSRDDDDRFASAERPRRAPTPLFDDLNWDYAVIERLNTADLTTQVIPFNLGRAVLQGDEASNVELMPGDVVTIYSQKDIRVPVARQTRLVSLEGEVGSPGVYQLLPGETLRGLIARAGGFTPQAYVYGLEFSREETRQRQRENLAAAITRLQSLSAVQSAREAANRRDDQTAANASAVSNAATQAQLARLSQLQPNGRIALELSPTTARVEDLPDVPLENADRIVVPPRPGFVTVAGAVVNNNAFVWKPGRTAGEYLRLAGADEAADPSNMFILRADGTVTHAGDRRGFFSRGNLESEPMQPGDALIVPNQLDFETWGRAFVRNLKDFSQIFSGFGIGIAAIHSIQSN